MGVTDLVPSQPVWTMDIPHPDSPLEEEELFFFLFFAIKPAVVPSLHTQVSQRLSEILTRVTG